MTSESDSGSDTEHVTSSSDGKQATSVTEEKIGTFTSLKITNFRWLFIGTLFSNAAQWIQQITLNWLVYDMTGSGTILGTINLVRSMASLGMIPVAGAMIDRMNRKNLMVITNGWLFIISLILGILLLLGHSELWFLFIFSFLGGVAQAIEMNIRQVVVFDLVPRRYTPNSVAIIQTGWSLMRSFGPGIGGFLILWFGAGGNFIVQACAYALITVTIVRIQFPQRQTKASGSPLETIREGLRHVGKAPVTRAFMMMGFILPIFIIPIFNVLPPVYAVEVFGDGSGRVLGLLMGSVGIGGIGGGVVVASLGRVERRGLVQLASLFLLCLSLIWFAFSTELWIALLQLALAGFFEMIFLTTNQTLLQLSIPDAIRGRVTSVVNLNAALTPLGSMLAGVGSDLLGGPKVITIFMASIGAGIAILVFLFSKTIRNYRLSEEISRV